MPEPAVANAADLKKALMFLGGLPVAWLVPPKWWPAPASLAARLPLLRARPRRRLQPGLVRLLGKTETEALARLQSAYFQDCLSTLRAWRPWPAGIEVRLNGREHIDGALKQGKGLIVWVAQLTCAPIVAKMALHQAGFEVTHLSRPSHRFSATRLGIRVLNPIQTRVEARYLHDRVNLQGDSFTGALLRVRRTLAANGVMSITAGGPADEKVAVPFMGGELTLPAGALHLSLITGAPVVPLYVLPEGPTTFEARLETALPLDTVIDRDAAYRAAATEFAWHLERVLESRPDTWAGWQA